MFAEDFMSQLESCPLCGKVLTLGEPCINCTIQHNLGKGGDLE